MLNPNRRRSLCAITDKKERDKSRRYSAGDDYDIYSASCHQLFLSRPDVYKVSCFDLFVPKEK